MTVAFGAVLGLLVQGHSLDADLSGKLMRLVKSGELPFHAVTRDDLKPLLSPVKNGPTCRRKMDPLSRHF
jgi:hypothetical protein